MVKAVTANKMAEQELLAVQDLMAEAQAAKMVIQAQAKVFVEAEAARDGMAASRTIAAETLHGQHYTVIQLASEAAEAEILTFKEASEAEAEITAAQAAEAATQVADQVAGHIPVTVAEADLIIVDQIKAIHPV